VTIKPALHHRDRLRGSGGQPSAGELSMLNYIHKHPGATVTEVCEATHHRGGNANGLVKAMERVGWLERRPLERARRGPRTACYLRSAGYGLLMESTRIDGTSGP
jgi:hypothetical protein